MKRFVYFLAIPLFLVSCNNDTKEEEKSGKKEVENVPQSDVEIQEGTWRLALYLDQQELPFSFDLKKEGDSYSATIINADERIPANSIFFQDDSIHIKLPVFDSELIGKVVSPSEINGMWYNYAKGDYTIPFSAQHNQDYRFDIDRSAEPENMEGKWEVTFSPNNAEDRYKAVGVFKQDGHKLFGTFLTETGDYRYLEGNVEKNKLLLSCFDGAHAFVFDAVLNGDSLNGSFRSGKHWKEPWVATRNNDFELTNPDSLTFIKPGEKLAFTFPNLDSNMVSFPSERYDNKVVIIQIMGSWCPNCKDETALYAELYEKYHHRGLEIISLGFEAKDDFGNATGSIRRLKEHFNCGYEFLLAGGSNKVTANALLPMFNKIISYPTSVFIDRNGNVQKIHTGFYGPGTGKYYDRYVEETTIFLEKLLAEGQSDLTLAR